METEIDKQKEKKICTIKQTVTRKKKRRQKKRWLVIVHSIRRPDRIYQKTGFVIF